MKRQVQDDRESHLGNFTKLALDIQRYEKYNPVLWGNVLKRSTKRLESFDNAFRARKPRKRARTPSSTPFPALTSTVPSLSEYLDQPDMVREMLQEINASPTQRDQDTVNQPEAQPRPAVLDPRSNEPQATNPTLKLPIIHVVTPRTRQHISRLPPPRESDLIAINQLENIADDAMAKKVHAIENLTRPNSLYGRLHRRAKSPVKTPRRAAIYSTKQIPDSRPKPIEPVKTVIPPTTELKSMKKEDINVRLLQDEWTPMSQEDTDIAFPPLARQRRAHYRNKTAARDHQNTIQQSYDVAIAKSDATRAVVSSIDAIKQWVPLELIYAHGRGGFASMHIEKAMQMVTGALRRLSNNQCRTAWKMWRDFCVQASTEEESRSALRIQCAWRQFRARCEANVRREIRRRQHEREQYLLRRIASKREYAAKCIARSMRRYAAACVAYKERQRNQAAQRIQRFVRSRRAMWARFARFLEHQRCKRAAVRIQTCARGYLARAKVRLLRKLRAVALRAKAIEAVLEEKSHKMRLIGAALVVQRNVRRRRAARKAKFGAMRRRHAKKVKAAVKVQSIVRMFLAMRLRRNMEAKYTKAAVKIQYAYRCYHSRKLRREYLAKRADAKKKRLAIKKEIRREKKRRQKAKENAGQATKIWMTVQDAAKTIQTRRPQLFQMTPERAALCIQGGWRGFKTRRRLKRQFAKERELERRRVNRLQKAAAMTIQRIVRGMLGRKLFWHTRLIRYVTSIQRLFRNRKARRDIALMQAYIKAAILIQKRWINKKEFVFFRKRRRAAVKIQSTGRMYIDRQAYWRRIQAHQVILETKIAGQVNFVSRTLGIIEAQLLQLSLQYPFDGKPNHSVQVMRRLYKRDPTTGQWSSSGSFGLWQVLFLDLCRYGNSMDATEIDNMRFSRFLKDIPGMLHKSLCPLQNVDIAFAKFKSPKSRTIPYSGFQKAMTYLLTLRYPDKAPVHYTMDQRFLFFVQQLLLVSKFGEQYRLKLTQWAMERSNWAAHVLQTMFRHHQHQMHHQEFVKRYMMMRRLEEEARAATLLQKKWRQRMAKLKFQSIVCDAFVEYVDWKSGARSYKNLITNTTTFGRPAILGGLSPSVSIKMPPPGEEYLAYCLRHETKPADLATLYCLECEEAMCSYCFERDHKRKAFADHASLPIFMCSLCSKQTASRTCNQCHDGHVPYCDTCYPHFHKNKNVNHTFVALVTLCVECGDKVGRWQCTTCTDFFCKKDFSAFHRKGQRQNHEMLAVSYLPLEAKAAQDRRLRDKEQLEAAHDQEVSREVQQLELQKQEVAAIIIQTAYRGMRDRIAGKSYMKTIRYTNRMMQQRLKDDVIRSAFTYKLRKAVGFAPILASDTAEEVESILQRKEQITTALGLATYDYTKGVPPWCFYNAPVEILQGEFKSFRATIVSTNQVVSSGVVMVHVTEANKSITLPLMHIKPLEETPSPSKVALVAQKVGTAAHKLQLNLLDRVEQKRLAIKLLHHRTEFKELEEYAWIEQRDDATGKTTWWNVVSNAKSGVKPKSLAALETMEPAEQEDLQVQMQEARDKIIKLHSRSDRGAGARRDSVDAAFDGQHVQAIHEALFWHDSLWSHPHVGKKARDLVKELNTDSLRSTVQLLSRANEVAGDDSAKWEKAVLKFCSLRTAEKKEILDETADMTSKDALAVLWNLVDPNAKSTNDQDDS
ncbi:hypothetical protein Ae201684_001190 [Aphanomyces euteiches]|uniref:B box-type domain-containing protein n=1 Tax=Aphanomyces euteiches TaxID=100861 RepID=A0A6G0XWG8_9STRA|nr:hypothetical protein Ae201684_001190 [Aphanomyces euteiches]